MKFDLRERRVDLVVRGAIAVVLAIVAATIFLRAADDIEFRGNAGTPWITEAFHGDESGWISSSLYHTDLLLHGDFDWVKWSCSQCQTWGSLNPQLGKFLLGIPLRLTGSASDNDFFAFYDWGGSYDENVSLGTVPPPRLLKRARSGVAVFGVLCVMAGLALGYRCGGTLVGVAFVFLMLSDAGIVWSFTRARTDAHYGFLVLCLCLAVTFFTSLENRRRALLLMACCGALSGLAGSVKITGIVVGAALAVAVLFWTCRLAPCYWKRALACFAVFLVCALAVIYVLNPYYWIELSEVRPGAAVAEIRGYLDERPAAPIQSNTVRQRYPQLANLARPLEFPRMFSRWSRFLTWQRDTFGLHWQRGRLKAIHQDLFYGYPRWPFHWILLIVGAAFAGSRAVRSLKKGEPSLWGVPLIYFLIQYAILVAFLKLEWYRYYLPAIVAANLVAAIGVYASLVVGGKRLVARVRERRP